MEQYLVAIVTVVAVLAIVVIGGYLIGRARKKAAVCRDLLLLLPRMRDAVTRTLPLVEPAVPRPVERPSPDELRAIDDVMSTYWTVAFGLWRVTELFRGMRTEAEGFFQQADRVIELRATYGPDPSELAAALAELEVRRAAVLAAIPPLEDVARRFIKNS